MTRTARLGAFILGCLAILALGIFIVGSRRYLFTPTYILQTKFANVNGLNVGADVRVGGVTSGTVQSLEMPHGKDNRITVTLKINHSVSDIIKKDSVATIETEGMLGSQYVAISYGSPGATQARDGDTLQSNPPLQMSQLFGKASTLLDTSNVAMDNIAHTTANLNAITTNINQGNGTVGALIHDRSLYNNLEDTSAKAKDTVAAAQVGVTDFQENMEALKNNFLLRGYFKKRGYTDSSEIEKNEIAALPQATPIKEFSYSVKSLFDKKDTAKLKNGKQLEDAGKFLAGNDFGLAVLSVSSGTTGVTDKDLELAKGRAMVLTEYLAEHYAFDDTKLKTLPLGKDETGNAGKDGWGMIHISVYPVGTPVPADKPETKK